MENKRLNGGGKGLNGMTEAEKLAAAKRVFDDNVFNTVMVDKAARSESYMEEADDTDELKELCLKHVPFWDELTGEDLEVKIITIALTNKVYMVRLVNPETGTRRLNKVLLRMIHPEKQILYDIDHQNEVSKLLGDYRFCPRIVSTFAGGRIEKWLEGFVLHTDSLWNLSVLTSVATLLAKFHKTVTAVAPKDWDRNPSMITKTEEWIPKCHKINEEMKLGLDVGEIDELFGGYKKFLEEYLSRVEMPEWKDSPLRNGIRVDSDEMGEEEEEGLDMNSTTGSRRDIDDEELVAMGTNYPHRILFCHNDMHMKNFIATYDGLKLIDFEYSSFNYAGADIAFFLTESIFDFERTPFVVNRDNELSYELKAMFASVYLSESLGVNVLPSRKDIIDPFLKNVELYTLGSLIFWAYWGIIMRSLHETNATFDYIDYTRIKVKLYKERFAEFKKKNGNNV